MKAPRMLDGVTIVDIGAKGRSIGKKDGNTYLCNGGVPGDVVVVEVFKKKKGYFEARVIRVTAPSSMRVDPVCAHFGTCGGCAWQNLDYMQQCRLKQNQVSQQIKRIGGMTEFEELPVLTCALPFHYRNKMEYTFTAARWLSDDEIRSGQEFNNRTGIGFHVPGRFDGVLHIDTCHLQNHTHNAMRNYIHEQSVELGLSYDRPREKSGTLRNVVFRCNRQGEWMVTLVVREEPSTLETLMGNLVRKYPEIHSLWLIRNEKANDSYTDCPSRLVHGQPFICEYLERPNDAGRVNYRIGPKSFFQTNTHQAERLYEVIRHWSTLTGDEVVYDLYTGLGSIALFLADKAKRVVGIEYVPEAVADAMVNATDNGIVNCTFVAGDMSRVFTAQFIDTYGKPDLLITDPPRSGMQKVVVDRIVEAQPERIIYVSCDPATQARDMQLLSEKYDLVRIQPVDMFPHTAHLENVAELRLRH